MGPLAGSSAAGADRREPAESPMPSAVERGFFRSRTRTLWTPPSTGDWLRALPGLVAVGLFVLWTAIDAGYLPTLWYPGALVLAGLLVVVLVTIREGPSTAPRTTWIAIGALGAFTLWSFASIAWADVKGDAWDGANRTLLYLVVFTLFALFPWGERAAAMVLGCFALGVTAAVAAWFFAAAGSHDPASYFIRTRFTDPAGYPNANVALALGAFWPAVFLSSRRETPGLLRAVFLAAAGVALELAIIPQSRGSLFAFPIVLLLYLAFVPNRIRSAMAFALVGALAVAWKGALLGVYAADEGSLAAAVDRASHAILVSAAILFAVGLLLWFVERRIVVTETTRRTLSRAFGGAAIVAGIAGIAVALVVLGNPVTRISRGWTEFKAGQPSAYGSSHFSVGLGSNRYDFWRVAVAEFEEQPIGGIGADNFAVDYVRERRSSEEPKYPHSLLIQVLSQTGIVGSVLFLGFLCATLVGIVRSRNVTPPLRRALIAACSVTFAYWLVHGSVDWFWEFPALGAPAFAWLGMAAGLGRRRELPRRADPRGRGARYLRRTACGVAVVVVAVTLTLPWLAARDVQAAVDDWRQNPAHAFDELSRARRLNPLSDQADLVAGAIASRLGQWSRMREEFLAALQRNPLNWYARLELAVVDSIQGRTAEALASVSRARALNPTEPAIGRVAEALAAGRSVRPTAIDDVFLERVKEVTH